MSQSRFGLLVKSLIVDGVEKTVVYSRLSFSWKWCQIWLIRSLEKFMWNFSVFSLPEASLFRRCFRCVWCNLKQTLYWCFVILPFRGGQSTAHGIAQRIIRGFLIRLQIDMTWCAILVASDDLFIWSDCVEMGLGRWARGGGVWDGNDALWRDQDVVIAFKMLPFQRQSAPPPTPLPLLRGYCRQSKSIIKA